MTAVRSRHAALSGSQAKAPGFAGGYLLGDVPDRGRPDVRAAIDLLPLGLLGDVYAAVPTVAG